MRIIEAVNGSPIYVGHQLDNEATAVQFDAFPFYDAFGTTGTFSIYVQRYGETEGYPVGSPLVYVENGYVYWVLTSTDVAIAGQNECQLRYVVNDTAVMSLKYIYNVQESIVLGNVVPGPVEEWADAIVETVSQIVDLTVSSHVETTAPSVTKTGGTGGTPVNLDFGLVKGDKGDTGTFSSVSASVDSTTGTPAVAVTYDGSNVAFAFSGLKGDKGNPGSGSSVDWGGILGTMSDQQDLTAALAAKEATSNKVTSLSSSSTDTQYPSAKCVYDLIGDIESVLESLL